MQFNVNKCSIMSVVKGNRSVDYTLNDNTLGRSYSVRDLGVQISSDLRPREQCIIARKRAMDRHVVSGESIGSSKRRLDQSMDRDDRWDG